MKKLESIILKVHYAAGFFEVCSLIIENVDDKNPKNKEGITPLHIAAGGGYFEVFKIIHKNAADTFTRDNLGNTL